MVNPVKLVARSLLGSVFVVGGLNQLKAPTAIAPMVDRARTDYGIDLPTASSDLVTLNGVGMVAAGTTMALGIRPRLSALALIGMLVPTTIVGHPFWATDDPRERFEQKSAFFANTAIVGGLLMVLLDRH